MAFKAVLIVIVIAILMEDSTSMRKKTEEEKKEDEEIEKAVNATLAEEEEKKRLEEEKKKKEDEAKIKKLDKEKSKKEGNSRREDQPEKDNKPEGQDEACPSANFTCPEIKPCSPCEECGSCPDVDPCQPCGPCPPIHCQPCPVVNRTNLSVPDGCPEAGGMTIPVAMAVGAIASLLVTGVATAIGLLLRYASPIESGFVFLASLILMWYLSSHHPEVARELGGRVVTLLREATNTLGHRIAEAIRHRDQVSFPPNIFF
jgi:hypothetical protein